MNFREEMGKYALKLAQRASGYKMTGDYGLATAAMSAANRLREAAMALEVFESAEDQRKLAAKHTINTAAEFEATRHDLGLTQSEFSTIARLGDSKTTGARRVSRWERGEVPIPGWAGVLMEALLSGWRPVGMKGETK